MRKRGYFAALMVIVAVMFFSSTITASAAGLLKQGMKGSEVEDLQKDLKKLGYFDTEITGYYGEVTADAVSKLQKKYSYEPDGVVGETTQALIKRLKGDSGSSAQASSGAVLKLGMEGSSVLKLQKDLKKLGFFKTDVTGYFGDLTVEAVKKFQKKYGYTQDGTAGPKTLALVSKLALGGSTAKAATVTKAVSTKAATTSSSESTVSTVKAAETSYDGKFLLPWSEASKIFSIGTTAEVYDIKTGLSFNIKRTYGHNHADSETVSAEDTSTMKKIFGGSWSWDRRAVIITVGDTKIAASIAGMPHAGSESATANKYISSRSGGFGRGTNYDTVKGNSMSGHFDVHFLGSKTHGTNRVDPEHQRMVKAAAAWAEDNLR